jgi:hypothetical protein
MEDFFKNVGEVASAGFESVNARIDEHIESAKASPFTA